MNDTMPFTLLVPLEIWQKIFTLSRALDGYEFTSIGSVKIVDGNCFRVGELYIPEQSVTPVYSAFTDEALVDIAADHIALGGNSTDLRFRPHSHGNGNVFWSGQDEKDIAQRTVQGDWMVSLVVNNRGHYLARYDQFWAGGHSAPNFHNVPMRVVVEVPTPQYVTDWCVEELPKIELSGNRGEKKCSKITATRTKSSTPGSSAGLSILSDAAALVPPCSLLY